MERYILEAEKLEKLAGIPAIVLGNGPSRLQYDIAKLKGHCIVFGCNRVFEDMDAFKGFPFFFGAGDDIVFKAINRRKEILEYFPLIVPEKPHPFVDQFNLSHIKYFKHLSWKNTGHAMIQFAIELGCSPIFIVGFGDTPKKVAEKSYLDNVYQHSSFGKGLRYSENDRHQNHVERFAKTVLELKQKSPTLFRIGHHSNLLNGVEVIEFDSVQEYLLQKGLNLRMVFQTGLGAGGLVPVIHRVGHGSRASESRLGAFPSIPGESGPLAPS